MAAVGSPPRITIRARAVVSCDLLIFNLLPAACWRLIPRSFFVISCTSSSSPCLLLFRLLMNINVPGS